MFLVCALLPFLFQYILFISATHLKLIYRLKLNVILFNILSRISKISKAKEHLNLAGTLRWADRRGWANGRGRADGRA